MKTMTKDSVYFKDFTPEQKDEEIQKIGMVLFSTEAGAIFLTAILDDLGYNRSATTEREIALRNYATTFLRIRLGLTTDSIAVTTALLNIKHKGE